MIMYVQKSEKIVGMLHNCLRTSTVSNTMNAEQRIILRPATILVDPVQCFLRDDLLHVEKPVSDAELSKGSAGENAR